jgi:hypothetical protein
MQARIRKAVIVAATSAALLGAGAGAGYAASGMTMTSYHCGSVGVTKMKNGGKLINATNCRKGDYTTSVRKNLVHVTHPS